MMQRICPVCDQVMKHAHYCSACHSWVKDPVYMNVTYYLNERHPKNEAHCSYHNGEQEAVKAGDRQTEGNAVGTGKHGQTCQKERDSEPAGAKRCCRTKGVRQQEQACADRSGTVADQGRHSGAGKAGCEKDKSGQKANHFVYCSDGCDVAFPDGEWCGQFFY